MPSGDEISANFTPHAPETAIKGRVLKVYGGLAEGGPGSIISISRGAKDGVEVGQVLAISRYGRIIKDPEPTKEDQAEANKAAAKPKLKELNFDISKAEDGKTIVNFAKDKATNTTPALEPGYVKLPDERVGLIMVFRVFDRIAYGLVMQASDPIYTLDSVHNP